MSAEPPTSVPQLETVTPTPAVDTDIYGPQFTDEMAATTEVLYKLGHRGVDHSDELTLTVTEHSDRFGE